MPVAVLFALDLLFLVKLVNNLAFRSKMEMIIKYLVWKEHFQAVPVQSIIIDYL